MRTIAVPSGSADPGALKPFADAITLKLRPSTATSTCGRQQIAFWDPPFLFGVA
jgi:hypothetical protein